MRQRTVSMAILHMGQKIEIDIDKIYCSIKIEGA